MVAACLISPSTALPDFLAPFRSMLGKKHQPQGAGSSPSPYSKPLSSPKDPSASHVNKHFGGPGGPGPQGGPEDDDPFNSNLGFGRPPSPNSDYGGGGGGPRPYSPSSGAPYSSGGRPGGQFGGRPGRPISGASRPVRQQPGKKYGMNFSSQS